MISVRTFLKTTFFWAFVMLVFRGYTRLIDDTPAKELLHTIGWSDLGNLTITNTVMYSFDSDNPVIKRLDALQALIEEQGRTSQQIIQTQPSSNSSQTQQKIAITIPLFSSISAERGEDGILNDDTFTAVSHTINRSDFTIEGLYNILINYQPTREETNEGLVNLFEKTSVRINSYSLENKELILNLSGLETLSSTQWEVMSAILSHYYNQFDQIQSTHIQTF